MSHAARASECSLRMTRRGFRECGNFAEIELSVRRGRSPDRPAYSTGNGPMRAEGELPKKRYGLPRQCAHRLAMTEKSFFRQERLAWAIGPYDADRPLLAVGAPIRRPLSCVSFRRAADMVNLVEDQREGGLGHSRPCNADRCVSVCRGETRGRPCGKRACIAPLCKSARVCFRLFSSALILCYNGRQKKPPVFRRNGKIKRLVGPEGGTSV